MVKSKLKSKGKEILNAHPIGHVITDPSEHNFLMRIFQGHPEYSIKFGCGIKNISIGIGGEYRTRCFIINRTDGTYTDISYLRSIDGATTKLSDVKVACRNAIDPVITTKKATVKYGNDLCPINGEVLTAANTHIDHYDLTFDELFRKWITMHNIDHLAANLNDGTADNVHSTFFTDQSIIIDFVQFHNANTHLRAVSKTANLSSLKKGRGKK